MNIYQGVNGHQICDQRSIPAQLQQVDPGSELLHAGLEQVSRVVPLSHLKCCLSESDIH